MAWREAVSSGNWPFGEAIVYIYIPHLAVVSPPRLHRIGSSGGGGRSSSSSMEGHGGLEERSTQPLIQRDDSVIV